MPSLRTRGSGVARQGELSRLGGGWFTRPRRPGQLPPRGVGGGRYTRSSRQPRSPPCPTPAPWTVRRLTEWTVGYLKKAGVAAPQKEARTLLGHVMGVPPIEVIARSDDEPDDGEKARFKQLIQRRAEGGAGGVPDRQARLLHARLRGDAGRAHPAPRHRNAGPRRDRPPRQEVRRAGAGTGHRLGLRRRLARPRGQVGHTHRDRRFERRARGGEA